MGVPGPPRRGRRATRSEERGSVAPWGSCRRQCEDAGDRGARACSMSSAVVSAWRFVGLHEESLPSTSPEPTGPIRGIAEQRVAVQARARGDAPAGSPRRERKRCSSITTPGSASTEPAPSVGKPTRRRCARSRNSAEPQWRAGSSAGAYPLMTARGCNSICTSTRSTWFLITSSMSL